MFKRLIFLCCVVLVGYVGYVYLQITTKPSTVPEQAPQQAVTDEDDEREQHNIQNFAFSKYNMEGSKELEIEGESADMLTKVVKLHNVIAKAYADDMPVTITADVGDFDKTTNVVHLRKNVVATTDDGVRLKTDLLNIHPESNTIETDQFTEIEREDVSLEGVGAKCEQNFKRIEFNENVRVVINDSTDESIVITCDGKLEIDYGKNTATFNENVIAVDANGRLKSDFMDVYYDKELKEVDRIYAYGNVEILQNENVTYCDNVLYLTKEDRIILGGDPEAYVSSLDDVHETDAEVEDVTSEEEEGVVTT